MLARSYDNGNGNVAGCRPSEPSGGPLRDPGRLQGSFFECLNGPRRGPSEIPAISGPQVKASAARRHTNQEQGGLEQGFLEPYGQAASTVFLSQSFLDLPATHSRSFLASKAD